MSLGGCGDDDPPLQPEMTLRVSLEPSEIRARPEEAFTIQVRIQNFQGLFAARCEISLPAGIVAQDPPAERGDLLGADALFLAIPESGKVSLGLTALQSDEADGKSGSGTLATLHLRAVSAGEWPIVIAEVELIDESGAPALGSQTMEIFPATAVIAEPFRTDRLEDPVEATKESGGVDLLIDDSGYLETRRIEYDGGLRYYALERDESRPDLLNKIFESRTRP